MQEAEAGRHLQQQRRAPLSPEPKFCISAAQVGNKHMSEQAFKFPNYLSFHPVPWGFHTTLPPWESRPYWILQVTGKNNQKAGVGKYNF